MTTTFSPTGCSALILALLVFAHTAVHNAQANVLCPDQDPGNYCDCGGDCGGPFCQCSDAVSCCSGGSGTGGGGGTTADCSNTNGGFNTADGMGCECGSGDTCFDTMTMTTCVMPWDPMACPSCTCQAGSNGGGSGSGSGAATCGNEASDIIGWLRPGARPVRG